MSVSAAVSTDRLTQSASSHITLSFSSAYCGKTSEISKVITFQSSAVSYLISCCKQIVGHLLQVWCLAGVDEAQHLFKDLVVDVGDCNAVLFPFLHLVLEHCGENRTSSCWRRESFSHDARPQRCMNNSPARIALCAWNSRPPTESVTSLNFSLSNRLPKSSDSLHSGTLNCIMLLCPDIFTLSATTLTYTRRRHDQRNKRRRDGSRIEGKKRKQKENI